MWFMDEPLPKIQICFFFSRSEQQSNNGLNRLSSTSDSGSAGMTEALTPTRTLVNNACRVTDSDRIVIEEMRACASELEDLDFDEDDDDDDSLNGHRRRNTDSK